MKPMTIKLGRFMTIAQYSWHNFDREFLHYDLADAMHLMAPNLGLGDSWDLGGFILNITPGVPFPPVGESELIARWHGQIKKLRELGKPFDFWAIFKSDKLADGPGYAKIACQLTSEENRYIEEQVGDLFWGWDMGEWDGLFGRDVMQYLDADKRPKTRREGHDLLVGYLADLMEKLHGNSSTIVGCTFPHYFHEIGIRMVGAEIGQALLNVQVYTSFLRGACRQYGLQYKMITSVFDRWGYRCYTDSADVVQPIEDGEMGVWKAGKFQGHSIGLIMATWVINYFAEAAVVGLDGGFYTDDLDEAGVRKLSPLGEALRDFTQWARSPHPRGRQLRPLALMLDYYAGWTPPRHLYSFEHRVVWHCLPYGPSDHGMDQAYDLFYPGYTWSGFYRDERGFITPTPEGDVVDVLLSDAGGDVLADYPVVWLLSDDTPDSDFLGRLRAYVEGGGHLVASSKVMEQIAEQWFALRISAEKHPAFHSFIPATDEEVREAFYSVRKPETHDGWDVVATTEGHDPVIMEKALGSGKVTMILADHGLTDDMTAPGFDMIKRLQYRPDPPFELLHCVQRYLRATVRKHLPIQVGGDGIYYAINEIGEGQHTVCLYNPTHEIRTATVSLKNHQPMVNEVPGPWSKGARISGNTITLHSNEVVVLHINNQP